MAQERRPRRPVMLSIYRQDEKINTHLCEIATYAGFLSHEHLYVKLVKKDCDNWPQFIRMSRKVCKTSKIKYTVVDNRKTYIREYISDDGNPPYYSRSFGEFNGDSQYSLDDIREIVKTKFFTKIYISDESLIKEP